MIGLPVLVIDTSCKPRRETMTVGWRGRAAVRRPLEAGESQAFCIALLFEPTGSFDYLNGLSGS